MMDDPIAALQHIRCEVLGDDENSGRYKAAFDNLTITDITDFYTLEKSDFDDAIIDSTTDPGTKLNKLEVRKILKIQEWYRTHPSTGRDISLWFALSAEELVRFITNGHQIPDHIESTDPIELPRNDHPRTINSAFEFSKSIKRDVTQYKEFTDDTKWVPYKRHLNSLSAIHGTEKVLDITYVPKTAQEKELFLQQNNFVYTVFESTLKTAKTIIIVREFEATRNGQGIYGRLVEIFESPVSNQLQKQKARAALTSHKLNSSWTKPIESFLVSFEHKLLDLEMVSNQAITEEDKIDYFIDSIQDHEALFTAYTSNLSAQLAFNTNSDKVITFTQYFELAKHLAKVIDNKTKNQQQRQRKTNSTKRDANNAQGAKNEKDVKGGNKRTPENGWLDRDQWKNMTQEQRQKHIEKWRKIRAERKANGAKSSTTKKEKSFYQ